MGIFLFLKQFVDMLYQWKILDYFMVCYMLILMGYAFLKKESYMKSFRIQYVDFIVMGLMIIFSISFFRNRTFFATLIKILSSYVIYFLGRLYGCKVFEQGKWLAWAGYIVVYVNLIYRCYLFGWKLFLNSNQQGLLNSGGFYYYKTDLAFAIILAAVFIYCYGANKFLKYFTIFPVCGYMIFYSGARMEMIVLFFVYCGMIAHIFLKKRNLKGLLDIKRKNILSGIIFALFFGVLIIINILPYDTVEVGFTKNGEITLLSKIMHARHVIWWNILGYMKKQSVIVKCFGVDLGSELLHSGCMDRAHSMYIKTLYSVGYIGCLGLVLVMNAIFRKAGSVQHRSNAYITIVVWFVFMMCGLTIESLEFTQMSWFPFLFGGALLSCDDINEEKSAENS